MKQELTIEQLKFAREIGATHIDVSIVWNGRNELFRKPGHAFLNGEWEYGWAGSTLLDDKGLFAKIDFTPLDEHEAVQEVPEGYYLDDESGKLKPLKPKADMVNHPPHYQSDNGIECIDAIRSALGKEGFIAYCRGNAMKYTWRDKSDNIEDWKKAAWYLNKAAEEASK